MILSTMALPNFEITEVIGIATGSSVRASGFVKDLFSKFTDFVGGKAQGIEKDFEKAKTEAFERMQTLAEEHQADAVMGVSLSVAVVPMEKGGLYIVTATVDIYKVKELLGHKTIVMTMRYFITTRKA